MLFFDEKFLEHKWHYFLQATMAGLFIFGVLVTLGGFAGAAILGVVGATSLGSSAFITFSMHTGAVCTAKRVIGGYVVSISVGVLMWELAKYMGAFNPEYSHFYYHEYFAAFAVGAAMFFMIILDVKHPPATGLALALVIAPWSVMTLVVILSAAIILAIIKKVLQSWMITLV